MPSLSINRLDGSGIRLLPLGDTSEELDPPMDAFGVLGVLR